MASNKYTFTVDVEADFGGRDSGIIGLDSGLPKIYRAFKQNNIKALFFVSTEVLGQRPGVIQDILNEGHEIGLHGHFHVPWKEMWRQKQNMDICENIVRNYTNQSYFYIRSPKFSCSFYNQPYSYKNGHVSLLKRLWFKQSIPIDPIFYIHPFDIVGGKHAPNLFSSIWYSRPKEAYETFLNLVRLYPGDIRLDEDLHKA